MTHFEEIALETSADENESVNESQGGSGLRKDQPFSPAGNAEDRRAHAREVGHRTAHSRSPLSFFWYAGLLTKLQSMEIPGRPSRIRPSLSRGRSLLRNDQQLGHYPASRGSLPRPVPGECVYFPSSTGNCIRSTDRNALTEWNTRRDYVPDWHSGKLLLD